MSSSGSTAEPETDRAVAERRSATTEADTRRLLAAGLRLLVEGDRAPTVAEIVQAAGLSNDAFYRAFRSKDELVRAIVDDGSARLLGYAERRRDEAADPVAAVVAVVDAVLEQALDDQVAAATRTVMGLVSSTVRSRAEAQRDLAGGLAELLQGPFAELGRVEPGREALAVGYALLGSMERFLFTDDVPDEADVAHLHRFAVGLPMETAADKAALSLALAELQARHDALGSSISALRSAATGGSTHQRNRSAHRSRDRQDDHDR